jgi:hypothetical protein
VILSVPASAGRPIVARACFRGAQRVLRNKCRVSREKIPSLRRRRAAKTERAERILENRAFISRPFLPQRHGQPFECEGERVTAVAMSNRYSCRSVGMTAETSFLSNMTTDPSSFEFHLTTSWLSFSYRISTSGVSIGSGLGTEATAPNFFANSS